MNPSCMVFADATLTMLPIACDPGLKVHVKFGFLAQEAKQKHNKYS